MLELVLYIVGFITCSGILAMVDSAILSVSRAEIEELVAQKKRGAKALQKVSDHITRAVVVVVIITNTINVLGPILVGQKAIAEFGSTVIGIITAILTFGTIVFSEIIPKSLGVHYAPYISRWSAPVLIVLATVLYPLVVVLEAFSKLFETGKRRIGTETQIRSLVTLGRRAGYIEHDEGQLIQKTFTLNDKTARDVMTPLEKVVWLKDTATIQDATKFVFKAAFSRYPVFGKTEDEVSGYVMSRDILEATAENRVADKITTILRKVLKVDAKDLLDDLLVLFRDERVHLAVVRGEGKTIGILTLEDVIEELVGEIVDEQDRE